MKVERPHRKFGKIIWELYGPVCISCLMLLLLYFAVRPTLADKQKIGFFSLDRSTQTEVSEIVDVKDLTQLTLQLIQVCI